MLARLAGNELTRQALTEALSAGRLGHSVLLCGEAGCGAGFAARCLAADYLYPAGGPAAEAVLRGESPECAALRGSGSGGIIKVEQIRAARAALYETSLSAAGRVQIVYGAHKMNPASANALLKILEEPPPGVLFILTAPGAGSVLPTIRSRCRLYTVAPLPQADCAALLRAEYPACDESHAQDLARAFGGRAGAALALLQSPDGDALLREARELAAAAAARDRYACMRVLAGVEKDKSRATRLIELLRSLCGAWMRSPAPEDPLPPARAAHAARQAGRALTALESNANPRLTLTALALRLCRA